MRFLRFYYLNMQKVLRSQLPDSLIAADINKTNNCQIVAHAHSLNFISSFQSLKSKSFEMRQGKL